MYLVEESLPDYGWDYLIILDACRYDYFKELLREKSPEHLPYLKRAVSPAVETLQWLNKVWSGEYDLTYFSTSPYVNSRGIPVKGSLFNLSYTATTHFSNIIDLWSWGWDEELQTIPPWTVNEAVKKHSLNTEKAVIHYMQPHQPFISPNYKKYVVKLDKTFREEVRGDKPKPNKIKKTLGRLRRAGKLIDKHANVEYRWRLSEILNIKPKHPQDMIGRAEGMEGVKKAYWENLELVWSYVLELLPHLKGRILITADHGEYLGEDGLYGHMTRTENVFPIREVPWLEIR